MKLQRFLFCLVLLALCSMIYAQRHYTFESGSLGSEWQYIGKPDASKYAFVNGKLRLKGSVHELFEEKPATFVGIPQTSEMFDVVTRLTIFDAESGDEAGLCVFRSPKGYVQCCLSNFQGSRRLKLRLQLLSHQLVLVDRHMGTLAEVWLRVKSDGQVLKFFYSSDGEKYHTIENVECRLLEPDIVGGGEQNLIGMYAFMASTKYNAGYTFADFDFFDYEDI